MRERKKRATSHIALQSDTVMVLFQPDLTQRAASQGRSRELTRQYRRPHQRGRCSGLPAAAPQRPQSQGTAHRRAELCPVGMFSLSSPPYSSNTRGQLWRQRLIMPSHGGASFMRSGPVSTPGKDCSLNPDTAQRPILVILPSCLPAQGVLFCFVFICCLFLPGIRSIKSL